MNADDKFVAKALDTRVRLRGGGSYKISLEHLFTDAHQVTFVDETHKNTQYQVEGKIEVLEFVDVQQSKDGAIMS